MAINYTVKYTKDGVAKTYTTSFDTEPTFDELKSHLSNFLNPDGATEETTTESKEPEMVTSQASSNVEDDFDKLFNS